jgi:hypothetical protein
MLIARMLGIWGSTVRKTLATKWWNMQIPAQIDLILMDIRLPYEDGMGYANCAPQPSKIRWSSQSRQKPVWSKSTGTRSGLTDFRKPRRNRFLIGAHLAHGGENECSRGGC